MTTMEEDEYTVEALVDHMLVALHVLAEIALDPIDHSEVTQQRYKLSLIATRAETILRLAASHEPRKFKPQWN